MLKGQVPDGRRGKLTVVVVAEVDELLLDGVLHLVERLDGLRLGGVWLAPGVDGSFRGLFMFGGEFITSFLSNRKPRDVS